MGKRNNSSVSCINWALDVVCIVNCFVYFSAFSLGTKPTAWEKNRIARKYTHIYVEDFASGNFDSITHNRDAFAITLIALQYSGSRKCGTNLYEIITKSNKKYTSS